MGISVSSQKVPVVVPGDGGWGQGEPPREVTAHPFTYLRSPAMPAGEISALRDTVAPQVEAWKENHQARR